MRSAVAVRGLQTAAALVVAVVVGGGVLAASRMQPQTMVMALAALAFPFVLVSVPDARKLLLGIVVVEMVFPLDVSFGYDLRWASLNALSGWNVSLTTLCLGLLYADWFVRACVRRADVAPWLGRTVLPMATYVAVDAVSLVVARNLTLGGYEVNLLVQALLLHVYVVYAATTFLKPAFLVKALVATLLAESLLMLALGAVGHGFTLGKLSARVIEGGRVGGTLGSPNVAGGVLTLLLAPALALALAARRGAARAWWVAAFFLGIGALILTQSRGAWLGFLLSMLILLPLAVGRGWLRARAALPALVVAFGLGLALHTTVADRLFDRGASPASTRVNLVLLATDMIRDHPVLGVGANNFAAMLPSYVTPKYSHDWIRSVHDKYFLVWAETGTVGLAAFLWYLLGALRAGWRRWRRSRGREALLALGLVAGLAGVALHMGVDLFHGRQETQVIAVVTGLLFAMGARRARAGSHA